MNETKGRFAQRLLKENLYMEMCGMQFHANHQFFDVLNRKLHQLFVAGIIDEYNKEWLDMFNPLRYAHLYPKEPQVLTMEHLEAGFVIWIAALSLSIVAFAAEWIDTFRIYLVFTSMLSEFRRINR